MIMTVLVVIVTATMAKREWSLQNGSDSDKDNNMDHDDEDTKNDNDTVDKREKEIAAITNNSATHWRRPTYQQQRDERNSRGQNENQFSWWI